MRNSIRPYRLASLRSKGEAQTLPEGGEAHGAEGLGVKATMGADRWLETEGSEGGLRETRRPAWAARGHRSRQEPALAKAGATPAKQESQHS